MVSSGGGIVINFHKYSFLDTKKLKAYLEGSNYWLSRFNPIWLFIWSDLYKPEICFTNTNCFIRFLMPEVGICYYPPLGEGNLRLAIEAMKEDAFENGIDFNIAPVDTNFKIKLEKLGIRTYENEKYYSYIYLAEDIGFFKGNKYKKQQKLCKLFESSYPNTFFSKIKKEEFPTLLEFINNWNDKMARDPNDVSFFARLNMIKKSIEHLYELDLISLVLKDEERIYGFAVGSEMDNVVSLHLLIADSEVPGAKEELISSFAKLASTKAKYLNLEETLGIKEDIELKESYFPLEREKFYATFKL